MLFRLFKMRFSQLACAHTCSPRVTQKKGFTSLENWQTKKTKRTRGKRNSKEWRRREETHWPELYACRPEALWDAPAERWDGLEAAGCSGEAQQCDKTLTARKTDSFDNLMQMERYLEIEWIHQIFFFFLSKKFPPWSEIRWRRTNLHQKCFTKPAQGMLNDSRTQCIKHHTSYCKRLRGAHRADCRPPHGAVGQ